MARYSINLRDVKSDMHRHIAGQVVRVAAAVHGELTKQTPVDTGWARANWIPDLSNRGGAPAHLPATVRGKTQAERRGKAQPYVAQATAQAQHGLIRVFVGYKSIRQGAIWIINRVPYVPILDRKHKSRAGFIQRAIDAGLKRAGGGARITVSR